jgi:hypothetical protein
VYLPVVFIVLCVVHFLQKMSGDKTSGEFHKFATCAAKLMGTIFHTDKV